MSKKNVWILLVLFIPACTYSHANTFMGEQPILSRVSRNTGSCFTKIDSYGGEDYLCISGTPEIPGRIALANRTTGSSLVVDPNAQKYAFLKKNGDGLIVDEHLDLIYDIKQDGPWSDNIEAIPSLNFSDITKTRIPQEINAISEKCSQYDLIRTVAEDLDYGDIISDHPTEDLFSMIRRKIRDMMKSLSTVLMNVLTFTHQNIWSIMRVGLKAFFNMIDWIVRFISAAAGGVCAFIQSSIRFSMNLLLMAKNGIEVLAVLLKSLADKFDLAAVLKSILSAPLSLFNMIAGLGGEVSRGISSVYNIISHLVKLITYALSHPLEAIMSLVRSVINKIQEGILNYFTNKPVPIEDYTRGFEEIEQIIQRQDKQYGNGPTLRNAMRLLSPPTDGNKLNISGVDVAPMFRELSGVSGKSLIDSSVGMFSQMKPLIPLDKSMKSLILGTMNMFNSPKDREALAVVEPGLAMHVVIKGFTLCDKKLKVNVPSCVGSCGVWSPQKNDVEPQIIPIMKIELRNMNVEILQPNATITDVTHSHPLMKNVVDRYLAAVECRNGEKAKQEVLDSLDSDVQFKQELVKYAKMIT